jgi:hypothetical protein
MASSGRRALLAGVAVSLATTGAVLLLFGFHVLHWQDAKATVAVSLAVGLAYAGAAQLLFEHGVVVSVVYPLLALALSLVALTRMSVRATPRAT